MQQPGEEPDDFEDAFEDALQKIPPEDLNRSLQENFDEMHAEAQIVPITVEFPEKVIKALEAYEKEHSIGRERIFEVALMAQKGRTDQFVKTMELYMADPGSFAWPIEDPLLCVLIAVLRKHAERWSEKVNREYDDDQGDWWKGDESE